MGVTPGLMGCRNWLPCSTLPHQRWRCFLRREPED